MNLILYIEFNDGTDTQQWTWDDMRGVPIPQIGDFVCPGQGNYRVTNRTFSYGDEGMTVYFVCERVIEE